MDTREELWAKEMRSALDGNGAAYERVLREIAMLLRCRVRARLARLGLGTDETEDIVQEILMALHLKLRTWDTARPFMPWLNALSEHKLIDAARRLGRARRRTAPEPVEEMADRLVASPALEPGHGIADPAGAIEALSGRERSVVAALGLEGITVAAAAARLSISEGAVRVAFHRGLARLARLAEGEPSPATPRRVR